VGVGRGKVNFEYHSCRNTEPSAIAVDLSNVS